MVTKLKIDRQGVDRLAGIIMNCANTTETTVPYKVGGTKWNILSAINRYYTDNSMIQYYINIIYLNGYFKHHTR